MQASAGCIDNTRCSHFLYVFDSRRYWRLSPHACALMHQRSLVLLQAICQRFNPIRLLHLWWWTGPWWRRQNPCGVMTTMWMWLVRTLNSAHACVVSGGELGVLGSLETGERCEEEVVGAEHFDNGSNANGTHKKSVYFVMHRYRCFGSLRWYQPRCGTSLRAPPTENFVDIRRREICWICLLILHIVWQFFFCYLKTWLENYQSIRWRNPEIMVCTIDEI